MSVLTANRTEGVVTGASHTALGLWSLVVIGPMLWAVVSSFKTTDEIFASPFGLPSHWTFDNYVAAWSTAGIGSYVLNSVVVVSGALVVTMSLGAMSAYVIARFEFPGGGSCRTRSWVG